MKKKLALLSLMIVSLCTTNLYCGNDKQKEQKMYQAIAKWFMSVNWYEKLYLKSAIDKAKNIDWKKVSAEVQKILSNKKK